MLAAALAIAACPRGCRVLGPTSAPCMKSVTQAWNEVRPQSARRAHGISPTPGSDRRSPRRHPCGCPACLDLVQHPVGQIHHVPGHARDEVGAVRRPEVPHELPAHGVVLGGGSLTSMLASRACSASAASSLAAVSPNRPGRAAADVGADPRIMRQRKRLPGTGDDVGVLRTLATGVLHAPRRTDGVSRFSNFIASARAVAGSMNQAPKWLRAGNSAPREVGSCPVSTTSGFPAGSQTGITSLVLTGGRSRGGRERRIARQSGVVGQPLCRG